MGAPAWVTYVTAAIAILAFIVSVCSLIWNVVSWRASGRQVSITAAAGRSVDDMPIMMIGVVSTGRLDVSIRNIGVTWSKRKDMVQVGRGVISLDMWWAGAEDMHGLRLPVTLPAGDERLWIITVPTGIVAHLIGQRTRYACIRLGDGRNIKASLRDVSIWKELQANI